MRRQIPAPLIGLLAVVLWLALAFVAMSVAFAQVGRVGTVGTFMTSSTADGGPSPPDPFGIVTEAGVPLLTESDSPLVTEAAP